METLFQTPNKHGVFYESEASIRRLILKFLINIVSFIKATLLYGDLFSNS
jgi:hypothetical protein